MPSFSIVAVGPGTLPVELVELLGVGAVVAGTSGRSLVAPVYDIAGAAETLAVSCWHTPSVVASHVAISRSKSPSTAYNWSAIGKAGNMDEVESAVEVRNSSMAVAMAMASSPRRRRISRRRLSRGSVR